MSTALNLYPQPGYHLAILGQTGSGKTTGAGIILASAASKRVPIAILDTKGEASFTHLKPITRLAKITRDTDIIVYRPNPDELLDVAYLQAFLLMMYERPRSGLVYVDELSSLGTSTTPGLGLLSLLARGRDHLVGKRRIKTTFIGATQRPRLIPRQVFTEARAYMVYKLADREDRKRVASFTHPELETPPPERYAFWFYRDTDDKPILARFNLSNRKRLANAV